MTVQHPALGLGVATVPAGGLRRALLRLRVRATRRRLDALLAQGRDPWSSPALFLRAQQVASLPHRMRVAAALEALVELAARGRRASPYLAIRPAAVLGERDELLALAGRLRDPAPVDVAVVARLSLLAWDEMSPVFAGGRPAESLGATVERCASQLAD